MIAARNVPQMKFHVRVANQDLFVQVTSNLIVRSFQYNYFTH
jgi:hypothetical protein